MDDECSYDVHVRWQHCDQRTAAVACCSSWPRIWRTWDRNERRLLLLLRRPGGMMFTCQTHTTPAVNCRHTEH